jgi:hypothetical protein
MFVAQSSVKKLRLVPNVKSDLHRFLLKCQSVKSVICSKSGHLRKSFGLFSKHVHMKRRTSCSHFLQRHVLSEPRALPNFTEASFSESGLADCNLLERDTYE